MIDPDTYKENLVEPKVYVTEAHIIGAKESKTVSMFKPDFDYVELCHNDYYLSLSYAGLNYDNPASTKFAYKLDGFDKEWVYTDLANDVTYTNLKAGSYEFMVRAKNSDGYWSQVDKPIKIVVVPALWQRLWFWLLVVLLSMVGLFLGIRAYTRAVRNRNLQLQSLNQKLSEEVTQRTTIARELYNSEKNLKEANRDLVRSNKQLEEFAYITSHDLKEPLRTIGSFTELSRRLVKSENVKYNEYMNIVSNAVSRMDNLIESILTFSSVGKGLSTMKVDLNVVINQNLLDLKDRISKKATNVQVVKLPYIWADINLMGMLFQNLISNAIKYNNSKVPFVNIYPIDIKDKNYVKVVVEDNGIGISKEYQKQVFELFKRLHSKKEFEGTGIGLSVCKRIVELHNGLLEIESEVGVGTKFIITLPKKADSIPIS